MWEKAMFHGSPADDHMQIMAGVTIAKPWQQEISVQQH
jgi:hypothetical protein